MRVVVNRLSVLGQKTGVGHYTAELLRGLAEQASANEIDGYPSGWLWHALRLWVRVRPSADGPTAAGNSTAPTGPPSRLAALKGAVRRRLAALKEGLMARKFRAVLDRRPCDLYHEPNHIPLPCDRKTLITLHDLSSLLHPEWHPRSRVAFYERHFRRVLAQGSHFITDCDFTRREVIETLNVAPERVTRVYVGVRRGLAPMQPAAVAPALRRLGLPAQYLLYVGTIEPRKNLLTLLRAYCALPDATRRRCPLLLVGRWGWNAAPVAEYLHSEARHRGVLHLGYLAEKHLGTIYNGARALVYPSLYEGFGMPPLEMMACGGAVLASTADALVEIVGPAAHLLSPHDEAGWRDAMVRIAVDDDWRDRLRRGTVELARPFTWERCAAETLCVYRALCGEGDAGASRRRLAG